MNIAVIGAGQMGGTLIRQYARMGHHVKMTNLSGPEKLKDLALETGASAVAITDVVADADVIIISVPMIAVTGLQSVFKDIPANTTIIDTCNYYPIVSGVIKEIEDGIPESLWVSNQIQRPVVKAYNSILYRSLAKSGSPERSSTRIALPIAGNDNQSKAIVTMLIEDNGFDVLDYGSLQDSWRQQPGSPVYCTDLTLPRLQNSIVKARKEILPERRELGLRYILTHDPALWTDNVNHNRIIYESELD